MIENRNKVSRLLNHYHIFELLELNSKYREAFIDMLLFDYKNSSNPFFNHSKVHEISNFYFKILFTIASALYSVIRTFFISKNKMCTNAEIVLLPFADKIIRFKYIYDLVDQSINVIYPPLWHFNNLNKHYKWYKNRNEHIFWGSFGMLNVLRVSYKVLFNISNINKCSKELDHVYMFNNNNFAFRFTMALLYDRFIRQLLKKVGKDKNLIWLFDYDLDYKYIIFNNVIKSVRPQDKTVHVQHGAFVNPVESYCNPVSDYSLCCCEREKKLINIHNRYKSKILVLGAPLQTFQLDINNKSKEEITNDITILYTVTNNETLPIQIKVTNLLKEMDFNLLLRYRPASKDIDRIGMGESVNGLKESNGTSLSEDIASSKIIVCFSEDALYDCFRANKPIVFCLPDSYDYKSMYDFQYHIPDYFVICNANKFSDIDFNKMIKIKKCQYEDNDFIKYNFGVFTYDSLRSKINDVVEYIKKDSL